ncbi:phosphate ABC transporter substrate-binding protein PstS [Actinomadura sp. ATCC 31491]|uniref:Phosphate-binding protein n=1 Tax=Actinomadura luzonensis TaxID=2805427 RepID=A0ABT0G7C9_9ACTN|nr:phosphate ABC transporter substrate-binding protein PstS [Actinomadura luzonensis]MCK2220018.1 phosphate ABC transporter substrate-binding protein PstS [Actinomadura luzonensis]
MGKPTMVLIAAAVLAAGAAGVGVALMLSRGDVTGEPPPVTASITGSGSTAQKGAMDAWRAEFQRLHPMLRVRYRANGSSAGIADFVAGRTAFAGSDVPMNAGEQRRADRRCGGRAEHLPMVVGPVAIVYNLPSVPDLQLSPATLTGLLTGRITRWDAPQLAADNPGRRLPDAAVRVFHRSDGSGTTHNLTAYLRATGRWPHRPDTRWTGAGRGVAGSGGITQAVQHTRDSLGYVEYGFAGSARLSTARLRNAAGRYAALSPESASAAVRGARVGRDLVVTAGYAARVPEAYPLVMVTYEIACAAEPDPVVRSFLSYTAGDAGQSYLSLYGYAPLPEPLLARVRARLNVTD